MRFFKSKKQPAHLHAHVFELPLGALARKIVYDSLIGDPEEIAGLLGFPPISEDVAQMEREASKLRIARVSPLFSVLQVQAQIVAEASAEFQRNAMNNEYSDELFDAIKNAYTAVAFSAAISAVSALLDFDILHMAGE